MRCPTVCYVTHPGSITGKTISNPANVRLRLIVQEKYRTYKKREKNDQKGVFIKSLVKMFRGETSPERRFLKRSAKDGMWREATEDKVYTMVQKLLNRDWERKQPSAGGSNKAHGRRKVAEGADEVAFRRCSSALEEATTTAEADEHLPLAPPRGVVRDSYSNWLTLEPPRSPPSSQITSFGLPLYTVNSSVCHSLNPTFYDARRIHLPDKLPTLPTFPKPPASML
jgi:hypothetical protein